MKPNYLDIEEVVDAAWVATGHDRYALDTNPATHAQAEDAVEVLVQALRQARIDAAVIQLREDQ